MKGFINRLANYGMRKRSSIYARRIRSWVQINPWISFTFDDFPRSAFLRGGKILESYRIRGSFYASLGLMGRGSPSGTLFTLEDLREIIDKRHEIGSHTYDHLEAWGTSAPVFMKAIIENQETMQRLFPNYVLRTLSYPIAQPHPKIKKLAAKCFDGCRGGGQTFNSGKLDLNLLKSCFIDKRNREDIGYFAKLIRMNTAANGWLIFSTHDIEENPSDYGCRPELLEKIIKTAVDSRATILPVHEVLLRITQRG